MDWADVAVEVVLALVTGIALWLLLPRGVVLTKQHPITDPFTGQILPDTWRITNASSLPIRIMSITESGLHTFGHELPTRRRDRLWGWLHRRPKQRHPPVGFGASIAFDDSVQETRRTDCEHPVWTNEVVPPGETLTAEVRVNAAMHIAYRRDGWSGVFERRKLTVFGYS